MSGTITFRINPSLSGNKHSWCLERVCKNEGGFTTVSTVSYFQTLKAAKAAAAHLARKPIVLPHKISF